MTTIKTIGLVIAGVIVGLLFSAFANQGQLGGVYSQVQKYFYDGLSVGTTGQFAVSSTGALSTSANATTTGNFTIGSTGSQLTKVITGTATCGLGPVTIAPMTTSTYDCAVTGVVNGDKVVVALASTTPTDIGLKWTSASSTSGFIQIGLRNASSTGAAQAVAGATSSVQYIIIR